MLSREQHECGMVQCHQKLTCLPGALPEDVLKQRGQLEQWLTVDSMSLELASHMEISTPGYILKEIPMSVHKGASNLLQDPSDTVASM